MKLKNPIVFKILVAFALLATMVSCGKKQKNTIEEMDMEVSQYRVAIELITEGECISNSLLSPLLETGLDVYRWKNHFVLFGDARDTLGLAGRIKQTGIDFNVKCYESPMYIFDKNEHCGEEQSPKPWKDYLLTANLVDDTAMQNEYVAYHATQFEKWPEVAQGFCNADFQRLLVFKTGRQLLLVISVPSDKTLEELDPKTVENNPRVDEWNAIMGKYQEGIEGTAPGEKWVFLDKL